MKATKKGTATFAGFDQPAQNYSKLPHKFIDCLPTIDSMAELKVVVYILRHTWGFSEYDKPKKITTDEFMNGRKKRDGSRMDKGTGLSNKSVIAGLESAVEHGFILVDVDDTDKARIEKHYRLNMSDMENLHTGEEDVHSDCEESPQRSEKETKARNKKKDVSLSEKEKQEVNKQVDYMLSSSKNPNAWIGREVFADNHLPLMDWYHGATGQDCPKSKRNDWMKAATAWSVMGITVQELQAAYDMDIAWRKVFTSPNQLTDKALALRAQKRVTPARLPSVDDMPDQQWRKGLNIQ